MPKISSLVLLTFLLVACQGSKTSPPDTPSTIRQNANTPSDAVVVTSGTAGERPGRTQPTTRGDGGPREDDDAEYKRVWTLSGRELERFVRDPFLRDKLIAFGRKAHDSLGCTQCHNVSGAPGGIGPTHKGLLGKKRDFADGTSIPAADAAYIRESLENPKKRVVRGFEPVMPAYSRTKKRMSGAALAGLIAYFESIR